MRLIIMSVLLLTTIQFVFSLSRREEIKLNETRYNAKEIYGNNQYKQENLLINKLNETKKSLQEKLSRELLKQEKELLVTRKNSLKKEWCRTEPIVQRIKEKGCSPRTIVNRFCYGQCNSFYIGSEKGIRPAFKSCSICRPKKASWVNIKLYCGQTIKQRRVYKIRQCRCLSHTD